MDIKKRGLIYLALTPLLFCLSLPSVLASSSIERIKIATESWETYTNTDGSGVFLDITRAIFETRGIKMDIEFMPFSRAMFSIENQTADAMYGTYSQEVEQKPFLITPTKPIDVEQTVAIFKTDTVAQWDGEATLQGKQLGWVRGYDYDDYMSFKLDDFTEVVDTSQGLDMLKAERFDFFLDHGGELAYTIRGTEFEGEDYGTGIVFQDDLFMAFANNERGQVLAKIFDEGMTQLRETGQLKAFFDKYEMRYPF